MANPEYGFHPDATFRSAFNAEQLHEFPVFNEVTDIDPQDVVANCRELVHPSVRDGKAVFDEAVQTRVEAPLGPLVQRTHIQSSEGPFLVLPEYETQYPESVTRALGEIYQDYNKAFRAPVVKNREWATDYQYALSYDGTPVNRWVQIDMVGLPEKFLQVADQMSPEELRRVLQGRIFEIENSVAMYQLLRELFNYGADETIFKREFQRSLDDLRQTHDKPIALLAVTDQKYQAMREAEFGKFGDEPLTADEIHDLSGFDWFFGPEDFARYVLGNNGKCDFLLFPRTSDPVAKLKKPDLTVEHPLLRDPAMRSVIKAHAITFNVDNPKWASNDPRRINDTKEYLPIMGMAHPVYSFADIVSPNVISHLEKGKPYTEYPGDDRLNPAFESFLRLQGVNPEPIAAGTARFRAKPMAGAYGCYGHFRETLADRKGRSELKKNLATRGAYVAQPEMDTPHIVNTDNDQEYTYIDRNFFTVDSQNNNVTFMGGYRSLMPIDSVEAQNGRIHGNSSTVWAPIV